MHSPLMLAAAVAATSVAAALVALMILPSLAPRRRPRPLLSDLAAPLEQAVFLFDDQELVDATGSAQALLRALPGQGSEWNRLTEYLSQRLRGFESEIGALPSLGEVQMQDQNGELRLRAEWLGQLSRLTVTDLTAEGQGVLVDALSHRAQEMELEDLRETVATAPLLIWRADGDGAVIWANHAYLDLAAEQGGDAREDGLTWPIPVLFEDLRAADLNLTRRLRLGAADARAPRWFEVHCFPAGEGRLHYALPADAAVQAESALREFIQTLTKTFAHLPIGLAIFDRQRQLALFNPALVDLTDAGAEFLSARPTLYAFLDRLRERRVIQEPKDFGAWRRQILELEQAAERGVYEDTWSLPSGQTYQVIGRPHPDGAVAFLIEDITAEMTLTRRFRSEIELGQAVVDSMEEAIAVFSPSGELILSNLAYQVLWGVEPARAPGSVTVLDAMRRWQEVAQPNPAYGDIRDFVGSFEDRVEWTADLVLLSGEMLSCRVVPMPAGTTLVGFARSRDMKPPMRRIRRQPRALPTELEETLQH